MNKIMPFNNVVFYKKYLKDPKKILDILKKSETLNEPHGYFTPWTDWAGNWQGYAMNTIKPNNLLQYLNYGEEFDENIDEEQKYFFKEIYTAYWNVIKDYLEQCKNLGPWPDFVQNWDISNSQYWTISNLNILKYLDKPIGNHPHKPEEGYYNLAMNYHTDINENNFDSQGAKQIFTLTFYLNDGFEGGELSFYDGSTNKVYYYKPGPGDITAFPSFPPYYHGVQPFKGEPRYLIRTFFMYNFQGTAEWLSNQEKYGHDLWQEMEHERLKQAFDNRDHLLNVVISSDIGDGTNTKRVFTDKPIIIE